MTLYLIFLPIPYLYGFYGYDLKILLRGKRVLEILCLDVKLWDEWLLDLLYFLSSKYLFSYILIQ